MPKKLSKAQMRVAIAKDVIKQIELKNIKPTEGDYIDPSNTAHKELGKLPSSNVESQPFIEIISKNCHVCALGACLLSKARLFDSCPVYDLITGSVYKGLGKIFSGNQLNLIEHEFELGGFVDGSYPDTSPTDRMISIMKNIIKNKGTYRAPKKVVVGFNIQDDDEKRVVKS
jgi:hypothetical protein